jgi:transcriptional regulator with XRE-family HTH domain
MNKKTYENIRKIREMNDLTRDYVAAELEMSTSGYGKIERGEIDLTLSKLVKISSIFGVSVIDLLYFDVSTFFKDTAERKNLKKEEPNDHYIFKKERILYLEKENFLLKKKH